MNRARATSLSVVDQQVPPLFNIERILPERCEGLTLGNFAYRFQCSPALNIADSLNFRGRFRASSLSRTRLTEKMFPCYCGDWRHYGPDERS